MTEARPFAERLRAAERDIAPIPPLVGEIPAGDVQAAYAVQAELTRMAMADGRRLVGRKIGLTSKVVQTQLGVDQPDFGALFADMEIANGGVCRANELIQPRIEAEVAIVLERDLTHEDLGLADLLRSVAFAVPALEIVDSRIQAWKISIVDTIADNGSSARFVLGTDPRKLTDLDLLGCGMTLARGGQTVSLGVGAACLGHPMNAALWLARTLAASGEALRAGDIVLTGALGPMVDARAGDAFAATISGLGSVSVCFE